MARKFIVERGPKASNDRQPKQDRKSLEVRYTLDEAVEIFIRAKEAEGIRASTIKGYYDTVRYFKDWLSAKMHFIDDISATTIREYINYLRTERLPYQGDVQREGTTKGLSVYTINIRLRNLRI
jgi:integrase/recombinase XerD